MSKRQKYWALEVTIFVIYIGISYLIPQMEWWKYAVLGFAIGIIAVLSRRQGEL